MRLTCGGLFGGYRVPFVLLAIYLLVFLVVPVGTLIVHGFASDGGRFALDYVVLLLANPVYVESLINSLGVAAGAAFLAAALALPIAMLLWRYRVRPSVLIELCGFLPLFVPPFVLALSLQTLFGSGGPFATVLRWFGTPEPMIFGLPSVMLIEALHYFPLLLMTLIMTSSACGRQAGEAARLGVGWTRLIGRVFLPLSMPGLAFGMSITFLKALDDLATPLSLGVTNLLAPQAFFRLSAYGSRDPLSSLMACALIAVSVVAWFASVLLVRQYVVTPHVAAEPSRRQGRAGGLVFGGIVFVYAILYAGVALTSVARLWSYTALPESYAWTHYLGALSAGSGSFVNTLAYCGFAALLDVVVGLLMALAIHSASPTMKKWLSWVAAGLFSVPGVALAIAYLQFFGALDLPLTG